MALYTPGIFEVASMEDAQRIILTPEGNSTTAERWRIETPYLMDKLEAATAALEPRLFLDFGCGVGRMSREIIARAPGRCAIGVDASVSMRKLSAEYVASPEFVACGPEGLDAMVAGGLRYDVALSVWVLQHCLSPAAEIDRISAGLRSGGIFFIVDMHHRAVPTDQGWIHDGQSVRQLMDERFTPLSAEPFAVPQSSGMWEANCWIGVYRKP